MKKSEGKSEQGPERRRTRRRPVLDTFSCFVVIGDSPQRVKIFDLSEGGIAFDGEVQAFDSKVSVGASMALSLFLNQTLSIPLKIKLTRAEQKDSVHKLGAEFLETSSKEYKAYLAFLALIDSLSVIDCLG